MAVREDIRSVFISHSCKDRETAPGDSSTAERARWARLQYARRVRAAITDALTDRGYKVLLDTDELRPGGHWRADLHSWLGTCDGAVVLLDVDSVRSEWVGKEATILSWRAQLGSTLKLVPVFLPGFRSEQLRKAGLGPLRLDDYEAARSLADAPCDDADALAKLVVAQFQGLARDRADTPMRRWILEVAQRLGEVDEPYLRWAAEALDVTAQEYGQFTDRELTLAHHLLHVDVGRALACLQQVKKGLAAERFRRLVLLVTPVWVSEAAAQHLHAILAAQELGAPLLAVEDWRTGNDYVQRAHCCQLDERLLLSFPDKVGEDPQEVVKRLERKLGELAGIPPERVEQHPEELDQFLDWTRETMHDSYYALVGPGAVREDVLPVLAKRFNANLRLVLLGGPAASEAAEAWGVTLVRPPLSAKEALEARFARGTAETLVPS